MDDFLKNFFPEIYEKTKAGSPVHENEYCKYDNHLLTLFTSSFYLAALVSSLFASRVTRKYGRKTSMFLGGLSFFVGAIFGTTASHVEGVITGRLLLGVGAGFANQVSI